MNLQTYVLVDFENLQPKNLERLRGGQYVVQVFVGARQSKIPVGVAMAVHAMGTDAQYVQIEGQGRNALDFHLAFQIGRLSTLNPATPIRVVSKDAGYDPLIKHLVAQGIDCRRVDSIAEIVPERVRRTGSTEAGDAQHADESQGTTGGLADMRLITSTVKSNPAGSENSSRRPRIATVVASRRCEDADLLRQIDEVVKQIWKLEPRSRPSKRQKFLNAMKNVLRERADPARREAIFEQLLLRRFIALDVNKISYLKQAAEVIAAEACPSDETQEAVVSFNEIPF